MTISARAGTGVGTPLVLFPFMGKEMDHEWMQRCDSLGREQRSKNRGPAHQWLQTLRPMTDQCTLLEAFPEVWLGRPVARQRQPQRSIRRLLPEARTEERLAKPYRLPQDQANELLC